TPSALQNGKMVEIPRLREGDRIAFVTEPADMGEIMDSVNTVLPALKTILHDLKRLTAGPIKDIANNTNDTIERNAVIVERMLGRVDEIAASVERMTKSEANEVKAALHDLRAITESIKGLMGTTQSQVSGAGDDLHLSLQKLRHSVDSLDKTLNHVEKTTGKLADGKGTLGHVLTDDTAAKNLDSITDDARDMVHGINRLQTIVGLRTEFNYLAGTFKNYIAVTLMPRPDKFYVIEIVDDPRAYRTKSQVYQDSTQTGQSMTTTITSTDKFRLTFQLGKRIGPIAGRIGIKESTGGIGADLYLLGDRLMLSADMYDVLANQNRRVAGRAYLAVYKRMVYLVGGVDDVFNQVRTQGASGGIFDWFLGAQLVFNDEDLKSLLLFGGGKAAASASK
ncbi:MAG TPA: methyl-accepting chemotaxis protein, partial [Polyangia bacterium]